MTDSSNYWLIATDLDGTLLDDRYDYAAAAQAVDAVSTSHNAQVLLASSKTLTEMLSLAGHCTSSPLLVFENGTGMAWRSDQLSATGTFTVGEYQVITHLPFSGGYPALRALLIQWRSESGYRFLGFGDCTDAQVAGMTGLTLADAGAARQRLCTEPLLWQDDPARLTEFEQDLSSQGLQLLSGGRFLHVMPPGDKADAVAQASEWLQRTRGKPRGLIACGDAANDLAMLKMSDIALVFPDRTGSYLLPATPAVHQVCAAGPDAWRHAIDEALSNLPTNPNGTNDHE